MNYFVIMPDGQKYGPANVDTLTQWANEGRLQPTTLVEIEGTGQQMMASSVLGIIWPAPAAPGPMGGGYNQVPPSGYTRPNYASNVPESWLDQQYANTSVVVLVLFSFCCGIIALIMAIVAYFTCQNPKAKQNAMLSIIISGIMVVLGTFGQLAMR
ncbi:MAG: DUF4339 domain-containing protein [Armatimonadetes bacterium]|nr:DUF4339 domain-containing protein [Armatimonadota bacterium]